MKKVFTILVIVLMAFGLHAQNYIGKQKDIDIILKNTKSFSAYYMAGDYDKLSGCYTKDGKIFPGGLDIIEGDEKAGNYFRVPEGYKVLKHKVSPQEIKVVKKTAYDYGYYEGETQRPDGTISTWKGKYVIVWKKVNKDWKIYLDIWNRVDD